MTGEIQSFRDLLTWQKAVDLADLVYSTTDRFPPSERFGLTAQMRKACVSIPSNIAEGTRHRLPGYISRVIIALGEHAELETQSVIADRRGYLGKSDMDRLAELSTQVGELSHGLLRALEARALRDKESGDGDSRIAAKSRTPNPKSRIAPPV
jgi:four helix bundle protein